MHHFAVGLGVPLIDAARAADTLLGAGMHPGRVRLRATRDEAVSITVDLARFHDGAVLALAAAQHLAISRGRGRPRTRVPAKESPPFTPDELEAVLRFRSLRPAARLDKGLDGLAPTNPTAGVARDFVCALADSGTPFVITGEVAAVFHGAPWQAVSLDLCADLSAEYCPALARLLNSHVALPRGTPVRDGFHFDAGLVRAPRMLALRVGSASLNISGTSDVLGEYSQVAAHAVRLTFAERQVAVLTMDALLQSGDVRHLGSEGPELRRSLQLRALHDMEPGLASHHRGG